ncbi:hypothetical protein [Pseudomonas sp.]|uniref:hypothetical protein n=1 Tax=Pseudomonas sp. TaxID=306 RepID=UPI001B1061A9|nr:hypothetical protein [Pseudomonas sp.]MBO9552111.1 hypothetical protein [Pseudomonas sp.]
MTYEEHFAQVERQFLWHNQTLLTPSGLKIRSNGTSWTGLHEAFKGEDGTELVIGEHSDVEIAFKEEVESLRLEYYVVSDQHFDDVQMLLDTDGYDMDLIAPVPRSFYWLTLSGSGYTDFRPGPISTQPYHQVIDGPFRRLTISTSQAGTVHIRRLEWTRTKRH